MLDVPDFNRPDMELEPDFKPSTSGGVGRWVVAILLLAGAVWGARQYFNSAAAVLADDRKAGVKPVLMMFTADWCGPCQAFKAGVLADDRVVFRVVKAYKFEKVDLTKWEGKNGATASKYGVNAIPTLMVVNSRGQEVARYRGPFDPGQFAEWLDKYSPVGAND
jgi:thiol:disulfide interchange protein